MDKRQLPQHSPFGCRFLDDNNNACGRPQRSGSSYQRAVDSDRRSYADHYDILGYSVHRRLALECRISAGRRQWRAAPARGLGSADGLDQFPCRRQQQKADQLVAERLSRADALAAEHVRSVGRSDGAAELAIGPGLADRLVWRDAAAQEHSHRRRRGAISPAACRPISNSI
jgi:hypothetical protein